MPLIPGVYAAAVTPRREGPETDLAALFELLDFLCRGGVTGIVLMGSTGEFPHFALEERSRLVSLAVKRSRVPVLAGVGHSTFDGSLVLAREAAAAGAAGVLLMPPYYFRYSQDDIRDFYLRFAERLKGAVPLYLYNIPQFTSPIAPETSVELLATGRFAGIKDSTAEWDAFAPLVAARASLPFSLMVGHDALFLRGRMAGADGTVSGVASAVPELLVALDRAIAGADTERAQALDCRVHEFLDWLYAMPAPVAIRQACELRGIRVGQPAVPPGPETQRKLSDFIAWFPGWLDAVLKESSNA
ncbi:MAG: dihydrodipicolinate synthase family protein [Acidobacteriota bacterium]